MRPRIRQLLLDFDGVLATYDHQARIRHLADATGTEAERVRDVLFVSGLETRYDGGEIETPAYLARLGEGLGVPVTEDTWIASRLAGSRAQDRVLAQLQTLDPGVALGVLTNNGLLMTRAIPRIVAPLAGRLRDRVLCSGGLRLRKPDVATFHRALDLLGWDAGSTLFVDDVFANVQGARQAGLHADTVDDGASLGRVLRRYALA